MQRTYVHSIATLHNLLQGTFLSGASQDHNQVADNIKEGLNNSSQWTNGMEKLEI